MSVIEFYNPNDKPYGILSLYYPFDIVVDKKVYKSVAHYLYSWLLYFPNNKISIMSSPIEGLQSEEIEEKIEQQISQMNKYDQEKIAQKRQRLIDMYYSKKLDIKHNFELLSQDERQITIYSAIYKGYRAVFDQLTEFKKSAKGEDSSLLSQYTMGQEDFREALLSVSDNFVYNSSNTDLGVNDNNEGYNVVGIVLCQMAKQYKKRVHLDKDNEGKEKRLIDIYLADCIYREVIKQDDENDHDPHYRPLFFTLSSKISSLVNSEIGKNIVKNISISNNNRAKIIKNIEDGVLLQYIPLHSEYINNDNNLYMHYFNKRVDYLRQTKQFRQRVMVLKIVLGYVYKQANKEANQQQIDDYVSKLIRYNSDKYDRGMIEQTIISKYEKGLLNAELTELIKPVLAIQEEVYIPNITEKQRDRAKEHTPIVQYNSLSSENTNNVLHPIYPHYIQIDNLTYPSVWHYMMVCLTTLTCGSEQKIPSGRQLNMKTARSLYINKDQSFLSIENMLKKYSDIVQHSYTLIINYSLNIAFSKKFNNNYCLAFLKSTNNSKLVWADPTDYYLGGKQNGQNIVGQLLTNIRKNVPYNTTDVFVIHKKLVTEFLSMPLPPKFVFKIEKNQFFLSWFEDRVKDICFIVNLVNDYARIKHDYYDNENFIKHTIELFFPAYKKLKLLERINPDGVRKFVEKRQEKYSHLNEQAKAQAIAEEWNALTVDQRNNYDIEVPDYIVRMVKKYLQIKNPRLKEVNDIIAENEKNMYLMADDKTIGYNVLNEYKNTVMEQNKKLVDERKDIHRNIDISYKVLSSTIYTILLNIINKCFVQCMITDDIHCIEEGIFKSQMLISKEKNCQKYGFDDNWQNCIAKAMFNLLLCIKNIRNEYSVSKKFNNRDLYMVQAILLGNFEKKKIEQKQEERYGFDVKKEGDMLRFYRRTKDKLLEEHKLIKKLIDNSDKKRLTFLLENGVDYVQYLDAKEKLDKLKADKKIINTINSANKILLSALLKEGYLPTYLHPNWRKKDRNPRILTAEQRELINQHDQKMTFGQLKDTYNKLIDNATKDLINITRKFDRDGNTGIRKEPLFFAQLVNDFLQGRKRPDGKKGKQIMNPYLVNKLELLAREQGVLTDDYNKKDRSEQMAELADLAKKLEYDLYGYEIKPYFVPSKWQDKERTESSDKDKIAYESKMITKLSRKIGIDKTKPIEDDEAFFDEEVDEKENVDKEEDDRIYAEQTDVIPEDDFGGDQQLVHEPITDVLDDDSPMNFGSVFGFEQKDVDPIIRPILYSLDNTIDDKNITTFCEIVRNISSKLNTQIKGRVAFFASIIEPFSN